LRVACRISSEHCAKYECPNLGHGRIASWFPASHFFDTYNVFWLVRVCQPQLYSMASFGFILTRSRTPITSPTAKLTRHLSKLTPKVRLARTLLKGYASNRPAFIYTLWGEHRHTGATFFKVGRSVNPYQRFREHIRRCEVIQWEFVDSKEVNGGCRSGRHLLDSYSFRTQKVRYTQQWKYRVSLKPKTNAHVGLVFAATTIRRPNVIP